VGLKEQSLHLAVFLPLPALNLVEGSWMALPEASQDGSKANSTPAGVVRDETAVAVVIFLRSYYRKNDATSPHYRKYAKCLSLCRLAVVTK
jgi:hypothetical protein